MNRLYVKKRNLNHFYYWLNHIYPEACFNKEMCEETLLNDLEKLSEKDIIRIKKELSKATTIVNQFNELKLECTDVEKEILYSPRKPSEAIAGISYDSFENIRLEVFKKWAIKIMPSDIIYIHELDNKKLGAYLKERRNIFCYTAKEVAMYLGISEGALRNYECGLRVPPLNVLYALCEVYEVEIDKAIKVALK